MKKLIIFLMILSAGLISNSFAQIINQDAEGKSTIFYPGGIIGIDIGESSISFNYNNFSLFKRARGLIFGFSAKGGNRSGIANLFKKGILTPDSSLSGTLGYFWSFSKKKKEIKSGEYRKILEEKKKITEEINLALGEIDKNKLKQEFEPFYRGLSKENREKIEHLREKHYGDFDQLIKELSNIGKKSTDNNVKGIVSIISKLIQLRKIEIQEKHERLKEIINQIGEIEKSTTQMRLIGYANFGINASGFTLFSESGSTDLNENFSYQYFKGGFLNLGINFQLGGAWLLGASFGNEKTNNFSIMDKQKYTLRTTRTSLEQELISEKEITAYFGPYEEFEQFSVNADIIHFRKLGKSNVLAWNILYLRWKLPQKSETVPKTINLGTGANFFSTKGKLLGGVYLEAPDIKNAKEDDRKLLNRLTFGIVVKYTFDTQLDPNL